MTVPLPGAGGLPPSGQRSLAAAWGGGAGAWARAVVGSANSAKTKKNRDIAKYKPVWRWLNEPLMLPVSDVRRQAAACHHRLPRRTVGQLAILQVNLDLPA